MKIATWNVNSIRVRLNQLLDWIAVNDLDVIALQETKCEDDKFPLQAFTDIGYHAIYTGQKSYNGVALLAKKPLTKYIFSGYLANHEQQRIIITEYNQCLIVNIYVPNGQAVGSEKYQFKLEWLGALYELIKSLKNQFEKIIILGDFNIAPQTIDHTSANFIKDEIMISAPERDLFTQLLQLGFNDSFRIFCAEPKEYTWWDYRIRAFEKNLGYRIDHILISDALVKTSTACSVDRSLRGLEQPSDHAPVILSVNHE
jgi:exodeoxyribonuclease-3